jgi:hypothetical protein
MDCMLQNPAEHYVGQAARQDQGTCGFVLFWSRANIVETQYLFLPAEVTAKTRFPAAPTPETSVEFLPPHGKIFTIAAPSANSRARQIAAIETMRV